MLFLQDAKAVRGVMMRKDLLSEARGREERGVVGGS